MDMFLVLNQEVLNVIKDKNVENDIALWLTAPVTIGASICP